MKKQILFLVLIFGLLNLLQAQAFYKTSFALQNDKKISANQLYGNGIVDIVVQDDIIWVATGYGLNKGEYNAVLDDWVWSNFRTEQYGGKGGVSAMGLMGDSLLWIATAFDTTVRKGTDDEADLPAGSGLSYTRDGGLTWTHVPQPVDSRDVPDYAPTTTVVQNLIFDMAFVGNTIWIASFGGGLRRSDDMGQTWQVVTTDSLFFSSAAHLNHRAFSLLNVNDTLWVGTADGISKSPDNGQSWQRFHFSRKDSATISGDFIVALAYQQSEQTVWAATIEAEQEGEIRAVSRTGDWGKTWQRLLVDEQLFTHNFAFDQNKIFLPSDKGLYASFDYGQSWEILKTIKDLQSGNEILQEEYYSAAIQVNSPDNRLWLGSSDGLATTLLDGPLSTRDWRIMRSFVSTKVRSKPQVYAYPSPFSPSRHLYIRFEFDQDKHKDDKDGPIKIYDFAMDEVAIINSEELKPKWDGKNSAGDVVASGVYFFRAKVGGKVTWGKIVVIN